MAYMFIISINYILWYLKCQWVARVRPLLSRIQPTRVVDDICAAFEHVGKVDSTFRTFDLVVNANKTSEVALFPSS